KPRMICTAVMTSLRTRLIAVRGAAVNRAALEPLPRRAMLASMRVRTMLMALGAIVLARAAGAADMSLASPTFESSAAMPRDHTCDGKDVSPALAWRDAPAATKAFVLIVDDPDAPSGTWTHWVVYDIPATTKSLPEAIATDAAAGGGKQGKNDFHRSG